MAGFYEPPVVPAAHRIHAAFLARQVPTSGRRKTVAKTDSSGWRPAAIFGYSSFLYDGELLRATSHEPRATIFSRAEVHLRRFRHSEFVAAKRHFESEAACELRGR